MGQVFIKPGRGSYYHIVLLRGSVGEFSSVFAEKGNILSSDLIFCNNLSVASCSMCIQPCETLKNTFINLVQYTLVISVTVTVWAFRESGFYVFKEN